MVFNLFEFTHQINMCDTDLETDTVCRARHHVVAGGGFVKQEHLHLCLLQQEQLHLL